MNTLVRFVMSNIQATICLARSHSHKTENPGGYPGTKAARAVSNIATGKGSEMKRKLLLFAGVLFLMMALKYAFGQETGGAPQSGATMIQIGSQVGAVARVPDWPTADIRWLAVVGHSLAVPLGV